MQQGHFPVQEMKWRKNIHFYLPILVVYMQINNAQPSPKSPKHSTQQQEAENHQITLKSYFFIITNAQDEFSFFKKKKNQSY